MHKDALHIDIESHEVAVWDALVSGDMTADDASLHRDFLGVYPDGFAGKADHVQQLHDGPTVKTYRLSQMRVRRLGADYALISYKADFQRTTRSQSETMFVSSIWQSDGQTWVNIFSQDTPALP